MPRRARRPSGKWNASAIRARPSPHRSAARRRRRATARRSGTRRSCRKIRPTASSPRGRRCGAAVEVRSLSPCMTIVSPSRRQVSVRFAETGAAVSLIRLTASPLRFSSVSTTGDRAGRRASAPSTRPWASLRASMTPQPAPSKTSRQPPDQRAARRRPRPAPFGVGRLHHLGRSRTSEGRGTGRGRRAAAPRHPRRTALRCNDCGCPRRPRTRRPRAARARRRCDAPISGAVRLECEGRAVRPRHPARWRSRGSRPRSARRHGVLPRWAAGAH